MKSKSIHKHFDIKGKQQKLNYLVLWKAYDLVASCGLFWSYIWLRTYARTTITPFWLLRIHIWLAISWTFGWKLQLSSPNGNLSMLSFPDDQEETHNIISLTACLYISSTGNAPSWNWTEAPVICSKHKVFT